jgi:hypothetical protein
MTDLKLNADPQSVGELFRKKAVYRVPEYQRQFSWDTEQFDDLWSDIREGIRVGRPHHLNEVKLVPFTDQNPKEFQIIDGQQRLTTLSILIAALRDEYDRRNLGQKYVDELQDLLETKDREANTVRCLRLLNEDNDDEQYEAVYDGDKSAQLVSGQVGSAYQYFRNKVKNCSVEELGEVRFYTIHRLSLVQTVIEDLIQAFVMFSTTNARGLELSEIDVVKSILMRIAHRNGENRDKTQERWMNALNHAESADSSKPQRAMKDVFYVDSDFNTPIAFSGGFADFMQSLFAKRADRGVNELLQWLSDSLRHHKNIKNACVKRFGQRENEHINSLIRQFNTKNSHSGIILYWLFQNLDKPAELIESLKWASKLSLRLYLADKTAHKKRTAMHNVIRDLKDDTSLSPKQAFKKQIRDATPADRALEIELYNREFKRNRATRLVLYHVEVARIGGPVGGSEYPTVGEDFELEHIAPMQTFSADKYNRWRTVVDNKKERFNTERRRLGNLTLLRSRQNQAAGAQPFENKCQKYRTSDFAMSQEIPETYSDWGFEQIDSRTEQLANLVVRTFSAGSYTEQTAISTETDGGGVGRIQQFLGGDNE